MTGAIRIDDKLQLPGILDELRTMLQMRQRDLAEASGYGQSQISEWLRGIRSLDTSSLIRVAHALGYDLALIPREEAP